MLDLTTLADFSISFFVRAAVTQIRILWREQKGQYDFTKQTLHGRGGREEGNGGGKEEKDAPRPQLRLLLRPVPLHRRNQHPILRTKIHNLLQQLLLFLPLPFDLHPLLDLARDPSNRDTAADRTGSVERRRVRDVRVRTGAGDASAFCAGLGFSQRFEGGRTDGEVDNGGDLGRGDLDGRKRIEGSADGAYVAGEERERVSGVGGGEREGEERDRLGGGNGEERREGGGEDETGGVDALWKRTMSRIGAGERRRGRTWCITTFVLPTQNPPPDPRPVAIDPVSMSTSAACTWG
jgi:hypothetical protein